MEESNPLKNLRLVAYNERQLKRQIPEGQGNWFLAEACVRHVFITQDNADTVPEKIEAGAARASAKSFAENPLAIRYEHGEQAYRYLLMVASGLLSQQLGEEHAKGKIVVNWESYKKTHDVPPAMQRMMENLIGDSRVVKEKVLSRLHTVSTHPAIAARQIAGIKAKDGSRVLIVGSSEPVTRDTFKALGFQSSEIAITHPDPARLSSIADTIMEARAKKKMIVPVTMLSPENLTPETIASYDHVFICTPMGSQPQFEKKLVEGWKKHTNPKGTVSLFFGPADLTGPNAGAWQPLIGTPGVIDRDMIAARHQHDVAENAQTLKDATIACQNIAHTRSLGTGNRHPVKMFLTLPPEDYRQRTTGQLRPTV